MKISFLALILLSTVPAWASETKEWRGIGLSPTIPDVEASHSSDFERLIREMYQEIEEYSQSKNSVRFRLSHFRTRTLEEIEAEPYHSLATLPEGEVLKLARRVLEYPDGSRFVTYDYSWKEVPFFLEISVESQIMLHGSIGDVLALAARDASELSHVRLVTQFHMRVEANDKVRNYRAAVLWIAAAREGHFYLYPFDHVVPGPDRVLFEKLPAMTPTQRIDLDGTDIGVQKR